MTTVQVPGTAPYLYTYGAGSEHNRRITFFRIPGSPQSIEARVEGLVEKTFQPICTVDGSDISVEPLSTTQKMERLIRQREGKSVNPLEKDVSIKDVTEDYQEALLSKLKDQGPWRIEIENDFGKDPRFEKVVHLSLFNPS